MYWCLGYDYIRCNNNYVALNLAKLHVFFRDFSNHGAGGLIMYIDLLVYLKSLDKLFVKIGKKDCDFYYGCNRV